MLDPIIAARAVHFAATLIVGGSAIFAALVVPPAGRGEDILLLRRRWIGRLLVAALLLAILSGALWLLVTAANIGGTTPAASIADGTFRAVLTGTQFGHVSELRFALAAALIVLTLMGGRSRVALLLNAAVAAAFVAALAESGHAGADTSAFGGLHLAGDMLHLIAASAWLGGLIPLLIVLAPPTAGPALAAARSAVLYRFSTLATLCVVLLAASGLLNSCFMLQGPGDLLTTTYGNLVLTKLMLFLAMLTFAAINRYRLMPRLAASGDAKQNLCPLQRSIGAELVLGFAVVCVVAVLGQLAPPTG